MPWLYEVRVEQNIAFGLDPFISSKKRFIFDKERVTLFSDKPKRSISVSNTQSSLLFPNNSIY